MRWMPVPTRSCRAVSCSPTASVRWPPRPRSSVSRATSPSRGPGDRNEAIRALAQQVAREGGRPYVVPYSVSSALGAAGYASVISEIAGSQPPPGFTPRAIVHCSGSGATQAGLVLGAGACLPDSPVIGIDIDAEPARVTADVIAYGRAAAMRASACSYGTCGGGLLEVPGASRVRVCPTMSRGRGPSDGGDGRRRGLKLPSLACPRPGAGGLVGMRLVELRRGIATPGSRRARDGSSHPRTRSFGCRPGCARAGGPGRRMSASLRPFGAVA